MYKSLVATNKGSIDDVGVGMCLLAVYLCLLEEVIGVFVRVLCWVGGQCLGGGGERRLGGSWCFDMLRSGGSQNEA